MKITKNTKSGFTLIEILLVVAIIAILAGIVIFAINPGKQLGDTRNSQRRGDINTLLNAVYQYTIDNNGILPTQIPTSATCATPATNEICKTDAASCTDLVDLSDLTTNQKYLTSIPNDPLNSSTNGTGYFISKNVNSRVTICAPGAEQGLTISAIR